MSWHCYVFPRAWEDHCKIGFSHDPLSRIQQLHPRWFEFFDLDAGAIIETDRNAKPATLSCVCARRCATTARRCR